MKRQPLVIANWKMHGQRGWIDGFVHDFMRMRDKQEGGRGRCEIALCPPFVYLAQLQDALRHSHLKLGAQNLHEAERGAFTGEVSAPMLQDMGCTFVVVGHSERRTLLGEHDGFIASKFAMARLHDLVPVLCVGESESERDAGVTERVVQRQLDAVLATSGKEAFVDGVIAYEPVWAIGTGKTATPEQAQAVHEFIRNYLAGYSAEAAQSVRILYGGSVKADNAEALALEQDIDGALVGGASLVVKDFAAICAAFEK